MRRDRLLLLDIVEAARAIRAFVAAHDEPSFTASDLVRSAVVHKLIIIGEAATKLSAAVKERHPQIPWTRLASFRNILVHEYFGIQWDIVWRAAMDEIPALLADVSAVLHTEPEE